MAIFNSYVSLPEGMGKHSNTGSILGISPNDGWIALNISIPTGELNPTVAVSSLHLFVHTQGLTASHGYARWEGKESIFHLQKQRYIMDMYNSMAHSGT